MGSYLNPSGIAFSEDIRDEIYVDKTGLLRFTNRVIHTNEKRIVVSRPRRFGKTMAVNMLTAYYSLGCDSEALFRGLEIERDLSFHEHLNRHNVIRIDVYDLYSNAIDKNRLDDFRHFVSERINSELAAAYPDEVKGNESELVESLAAICAVHGTRFIFLLDEWDVIYREGMNASLKEEYTELLRDMFNSDKADESILLVYMTGILPIPEQAAQSGLNNFHEFTMMNPGELGRYFGFTQREVNTLCKKWKMSAKAIKNRYDGYRLGAAGAVYCPASVVDALQNQEITNYWSNSAAATELRAVVNSTDPEVQKAVRDLLTGHHVWIGKEKKTDLNDLKSIRHAMIALVHLGYLAYHRTKGTVSIVNQEVMEEFTVMQDFVYRESE